MKRSKNTPSGKSKPQKPTAPAAEMRPLSVRRCSFEVWSDGTIVGVNGSASLTFCRRNGRWLVNFSRNGRPFQFMRCRLVAAAFHGGMRPSKGWWVKHLNDDPSDDRAENLAWEARKTRLGRSVRAHRVVVNGREMCATEAARKNRKKPNDVLRNLRKGRSIERILATPHYGHFQPRSDAVLVEHNGERLSAREWQKRTGVNHRTIMGRWLRGIRGDELFRTGRPLPRRTVEYSGKS